MHHSVAVAALAGFFILIGLVFFALPFLQKKTPPPSVPPKKADLRVQAERQKESGKFRLAGLVFFIFGLLLLFAS